MKSELKIRHVGLFTLIFLAGSFLTNAAVAQQDLPDLERGRVLYSKFCVYCHGKDGNGAGPVAFFLNVKPRDFRAPRDLVSGIYKFKSSSYNELFPFDRDLYKTINEGLGGSAMPGLQSSASLEDIRGVIAYIKTFSEEWEEPTESVDFGDQVIPSPESFTIGRQIFLDHCSECHGENATGAAKKELKDDWGRVIDPRDLTRPHEFRKGNTPREIYTRVTAGIYGTPMPSFADPRSEKRLTNRERWHVSNYVSSLTTSRPPWSR